VSLASRCRGLFMLSSPLTSQSLHRGESETMPSMLFDSKAPMERAMEASEVNLQAWHRRSAAKGLQQEQGKGGGALPHFFPRAGIASPLGAGDRREPTIPKTNTGGLLRLDRPARDKAFPIVMSVPQP